jgi:hypothetical protein
MKQTTKNWLSNSENDLHLRLKETFTEKDFSDFRFISEIISKLNALDNGYASSESDVIFKHQPFLISLILGYRIDLKQEELEEITILIFLIWEFFKVSKNTLVTKITEMQYQSVVNRNMSLLKHYDNEPVVKQKSDIIIADLKKMRSIALLSTLFHSFETQSALVNMEKETRGIVMIGLKSLIECFEEIV